MEKSSEFAQAAMFEIIENQLRDNDPSEVNQTFKRLLSEGQTKEEAMNLIGCAMAVEMFEIMKYKKSFNQSRYVENLKKLPEMPWEENE